MKLFSYNSAKQDKKAFLSLTSLTVDEFSKLCVAFSLAWNEHTRQAEKILAQEAEIMHLKPWKTGYFSFCFI